MFEYYCKQIVPLQAGEHTLLVRCHGAGIAVVHDHGAHWRFRISEGIAEPAHVDRPRLAVDEVMPFESRLVVLEETTRAEDGAATGIPPRADQRWQTENIAHGHCTACVPLQTVIHTDKRRRVGRILVRDSLDGLFGNTCDFADA